MKDLQVQVIPSNEVPHYYRFGSEPEVAQKKGTYTIGDDFPNIIQQIIRYPVNEGELKKTLSVRSNVDNVFFHNDRFEVALDARGFLPQEITCTILEQYIEIVARKMDQSTNEVKRSMSRKYILPNPVIAAHGECFLTAIGVLILRIPWNKSYFQ